MSTIIKRILSTSAAVTLAAGLGLGLSSCSSGGTSESTASTTAAAEQAGPGADTSYTSIADMVEKLKTVPEIHVDAKDVETVTATDVPAGSYLAFGTMNGKEYGVDGTVFLLDDKPQASAVVGIASADEQAESSGGKALVGHGWYILVTREQEDGQRDAFLAEAQQRLGGEIHDLDASLSSSEPAGN